MQAVLTSLRWIHSLNRWVVIGIALAALVWLIYGLATRRDYTAQTNTVMRVFSGIIALQWLIGIVFYGILGGHSIGYRVAHLVFMTVAVIVAPLHLRFKNRDDRTRHIAGIGVVVVTIGIIYVGVSFSGFPYNAWRFPVSLVTQATTF